MEDFRDTRERGVGGGRFLDRVLACAAGGCRGSRVSTFRDGVCSAEGWVGNRLEGFLREVDNP